jgi:drug/metabolite transporter (DMT)-like permease
MKNTALWKLVLPFVMLGWALLYPASKAIVGEVSPIVLSFFRHAVGIAGLLPFLLWERRKRASRVRAGKDRQDGCDRQHESEPLKVRDVFFMSMLSLLGVTGFSTFLFLGIDYSSAVNSSILTNTQPIFTIFLAALFIRERFSAVGLIGAFVGIGGIVLVVTGGNLEAVRFGENVFVGNIFLLLGALSLSLYSIFIKQYVQKYGSTVATIITFCFGTVVLFFIALLTTDLWTIVRGFTLRDVLFILYIGIIGTAVTFQLFNASLRYLDVSVALSFKFLIPVFGSLFAILFLGERPVPAVLIGMMIVIAAIIIIQQRKRLLGKERI